jgi:ketosteroid isomerase-like protein
MYHAIVKHEIRKSFRAVAEGRYDAVTHGAAPDLRHRFIGTHALGGERHTAAAFRRWLERVGRLSPSFVFRIDDMIVAGMPWNTRAVVHWHKIETLRDGTQSISEGLHMIRLRWFRVVSIDVFQDTAATEAELRQLAAAGIDEALAEPITS